MYKVYQFCSNCSIDVFLGGGLKHFFDNTTKLPGFPTKMGTRTDGVNLVEAWKIKQKGKNKKAQVLLDKEDLDKMDVKSTDSVLGMKI